MPPSSSHPQTVSYQIPPHVDQFLASDMPDATPQQRQEKFNYFVGFFGGFDAAVAQVEDYILNAETQDWVMGNPLPPVKLPDKDLMFYDVGGVRIFYHSTDPPSIERSQAFVWSFYIGQSGKGRESILPWTQWKDASIEIALYDFGKWNPCGKGVALPNTRVRIHCRTQGPPFDVIFPSDPIRDHVPVYLLPQRRE